MTQGILSRDQNAIPVVGAVSSATDTSSSARSLQYDSTNRGLNVNVVGDDSALALSAYATNAIDEASATLVYICKIGADGAWLILKIDSSSNPNSLTYASVLNNPTVTDYDSAFTNRASLTYGKYNQAL
jgi:hypothetical protein